MKIALVGAGILGRLLALACHRQGWAVTLFDQDTPEGTQSCTYTGAGMLSPTAELDLCEPLISELGRASLVLWPEILATLVKPVFFQQAGTLVVAHQRDQAELQRFKRSIQAKGPAPIEEISDIQQLEPALSGRFQRGLYLPGEGQIDNRQLLDSLKETILSVGIDWQWGVHVPSVTCQKDYDWTIDCRGLGAQPQWHALRGVRGEIVTVHAPEVTLNRPIRLMHPRYPLYIVPREDHRFLIGATSIESQDRRPITVQSALELLSAAFSVHPGFSEATILEMNVNCRPTLPDNLPQIQVEAGLMRINGLYRHGFLLAPKLVELAVTILSGKIIAEDSLCSLLLMTNPPSFQMT